MPEKVTTYAQAYSLLGIMPSQRLTNLIRKLESQGHTQRGICYSIWRSQEKIRRFYGDSRFYTIFENEVKKWSWPKGDPRWDEYHRKKEEEQKAAKMQKEAQLRSKKVFVPSLPKLKTNKCGYVYFVQGESGGPIKIGHTKDIKERLKGLQTGHPDTLVVLCLVNGSKKTEEHYHAKFYKYRVRGEWFKPSHEIMELIKNTIAEQNALTELRERVK